MFWLEAGVELENGGSQTSDLQESSNCNDAESTILEPSSQSYWATVRNLGRLPISGVGIDVPTIGDSFHITKTNICWNLYPQELGMV